MSKLATSCLAAPIHPLCAFLYPPSIFTQSTNLSGPRNALRVRAATIHNASSQYGQLRDTNTTHTRLPAISAQARTFSSFPRCNARPLNPMAGVFRSPLKQPSVGQMNKDALAKVGIPNDIGLFENTLIMPTGAEKPSIFSQPKLRFALEWFRLKARAWDLLRVMIYKWTIGKPRPKLLLRQTGRIAQRLHEEMYRSFAEGDLSRLQTICAEGLERQFARRLSQRGNDEMYEWKVHRYIGRPRVVSHKAAMLPFGQQNIGQRQAVVKIVSEQSLTRIDASTGVPLDVSDNGTKKKERKVEYLVVQQRYSPETGAEPWKIWGTVNEKGWMAILERAGLI